MADIVNRTYIDGLLSELQGAEEVDRLIPEFINTLELLYQENDISGQNEYVFLFDLSWIFLKPFFL